MELGWAIPVQEIEMIRPGKEKGMFEGYLLEIGDRWIDVQNADEGTSAFLFTVGGWYPQNGGGSIKSD